MTNFELDGQDRYSQLHNININAIFYHLVLPGGTIFSKVLTGS